MRNSKFQVWKSSWMFLFCRFPRCIWWARPWGSCIWNITWFRPSTSPGCRAWRHCGSCFWKETISATYLPCRVSPFLATLDPLPHIRSGRAGRKNPNESVFVSVGNDLGARAFWNRSSSEQKTVLPWVRHRSPDECTLPSRLGSQQSADSGTEVVFGVASAQIHLCRRQPVDRGTFWILYSFLSQPSQIGRQVCLRKKITCREMHQCADGCRRPAPPLFCVCSLVKWSILRKQLVTRCHASLQRHWWCQFALFVAVPRFHWMWKHTASILQWKQSFDNNSNFFSG